MIKNYPSMDYTQSLPISGANVKINDIKQFFVNYIVNDNLGRIANSHLAHSDKSDDNALDPVCLKLAELHSKAVDFPKTGVPAEFSSKFRIKEYPDFMEKEHAPSYRSKKVIGILYRKVKNYKIELFDRFSCRFELKVEGFQKYVNEAIELKTSYDLSLTSIMNQYGIKNEMEIVTGFITNYDEQIKKKYYDVKKLVMNAVKNLKADFRLAFEREFYLPESNIIAPEKRKNAHQKASAWYFVTYHSSMRSENTSNGIILYSFPWIVYDYLIEIVNKRNKGFHKESEIINEGTKLENSSIFLDKEQEKSISQINTNVNILDGSRIRSVEITDLENFI